MIVVHKLGCCRCHGCINDVIWSKNLREHLILFRTARNIQKCVFVSNCFSQKVKVAQNWVKQWELGWVGVIPMERLRRRFELTRFLLWVTVHEVKQHEGPSRWRINNTERRTVGLITLTRSQACEFDGWKQFLKVFLSFPLHALQSFLVWRITVLWKHLILVTQNTLKQLSMHLHTIRLYVLYR